MDEQSTARAGTEVFTGTLYRVRKGHGIKLTRTPHTVRSAILPGSRSPWP